VTARPPTLREKRRYVLVQIKPAGNTPDPKELYLAVDDAVTVLWGDAVASLIHPAVVAVENGSAIVRCRRGMERELAIALSTVTSCGGQRIALRTRATSGTIESLRELIISEHNTETLSSVPAECTIDGQVFMVCHCAGQMVDVIEKGFKNTTRFFLTTDDLED
jgi:ribonuclease P/MRP protein subunit POP5